MSILILLEDASVPSGATSVESGLGESMSQASMAGTGGTLAEMRPGTASPRRPELCFPRTLSELQRIGKGLGRRWKQDETI